MRAYFLASWHPEPHQGQRVRIVARSVNFEFLVVKLPDGIKALVSMSSLGSMS
jgi:hypothetical protein